MALRHSWLSLVRRAVRTVGSLSLCALVDALIISRKGLFLSLVGKVSVDNSHLCIFLGITLLVGKMNAWSSFITRLSGQETFYFCMPVLNLSMVKDLFFGVKVIFSSATMRYYENWNTWNDNEQTKPADSKVFQASRTRIKWFYAPVTFWM